jgi:hypothetical protein
VKALKRIGKKVTRRSRKIIKKQVWLRKHEAQEPGSPKVALKKASMRRSVLKLWTGGKLPNRYFRTLSTRDRLRLDEALADYAAMQEHRYQGAVLAMGENETRLAGHEPSDGGEQNPARLQHASQETLARDAMIATYGQGLFDAIEVALELETDPANLPSEGKINHDYRIEKAALEAHHQRKLAPHEKLHLRNRTALRHAERALEDARRVSYRARGRGHKARIAGAVVRLREAEFELAKVRVAGSMLEPQSDLVGSFAETPELVADMVDYEAAREAVAQAVVEGAMDNLYKLKRNQRAAKSRTKFRLKLENPSKTQEVKAAEAVKTGIHRRLRHHDEGGRIRMRQAMKAAVDNALLPVRVPGEIH